MTKILFCNEIWNIICDYMKIEIFWKPQCLKITCLFNLHILKYIIEFDVDFENLKKVKKMMCYGAPYPSTYYCLGCFYIIFKRFNHMNITLYDCDGQYNTYWLDWKKEVMKIAQINIDSLDYRFNNQFYFSKEKSVKNFKRVCEELPKQVDLKKLGIHELDCYEN